MKDGSKTMQQIKGGKLLNIINIILPIVIVVGAIVLLLQNHLYNSREKVCDFSNATREGTSMIFEDIIVNLAPRGGDSGSWLSTNLCDNDGNLIYRSTVGTIYEIEILNNSTDNISDWSAIIRIPEEMYLNDA